MMQKTKGTGAIAKALIVVALAAAVGAAIVARNVSKKDAEDPPAPGSSEQVSATATTPADAGETAKVTPQPTKTLPRLLDLGAGKCIPCKLMAPILEELKVEYKDEFEVVFIDVWENQGAGAAYGIRMIPTQIFFNAEGEELFRHEGFYSREDILGKWKELGVELSHQESHP